MTIEIKKSQNPVKYEDAISFMEDRLKDIDLKKVDDLIWILEHDHTYTSGTSYNENEIIDKSIDIIKTNIIKIISNKLGFTDFAEIEII